MNTKRTVPSEVRPDFTVTEECVIHGHRVVKGAELSIAGVRGRVRFMRHVRNERAGVEWIDVMDGDSWRSFRENRVTRVHRGAAQ